MNSSRLAAIAACLLLAACGKEPVAPDPLANAPLTGHWSALGHGGTLVEVGIQPPGVRALAGCIAVNYDPVSRPSDRVRVTLAGAVEELAVSLAPELGQAPLWSFTGTREALDTIVGTGRLDGGPVTQVRLVRVRPLADC